MNYRKALLGVSRLAVALLLSAICAWAQFTSSLQGTVTDPSGAAVPGASVVLTNIASGVSAEIKTSAAGEYLFTSLAPGQYKVNVRAAGFAETNTTITLETAEPSNLPISLKVASAQQTLQVTGTAPTLDTADSRTQQTVVAQEVSELPLQGRTLFDLISFAPGVTGLGLLTGGSPGSITDNYSPETQATVNANGRSYDGNKYFVDGLDVTSTVRSGVTNQSPNPESVQELSVQTNTFSVEFGQASSIVTQITTKSGTNQFHGAASDYYTSQQLWTRTEFTSGSYLPFHIDDGFGSIGGPVWKNHTFFFASYEPTWSAVASTGSTTYEDPAFVAWAQQNFPNTIGTKLLSQYPPTGVATTGVVSTAQSIFPGTCGTPATANIPCSLNMVDSGTYDFSPPRTGKQWNVRGDQYWSKDRLYGNYYHTSLFLGEPDPRLDMNSTEPENSHSYQFNETHTFSPNLLNEAAFGMVKIEGIGQATGVFHVPNVSIVGVGDGLGVGWADGDFIQHNYHWRDMVSYTHAKHTLKFGGEYSYSIVESKFAPVGNLPSFTFESLLDLVEDQPYSEGGLIYNPLTGQPGVYDFGWKARNMGLFVQDQWRVHPGLTLNFGIRWDLDENPYADPAYSKYFANSNFFLGAGATFQQQVANGGIRPTHYAYGASPESLSPRLGFAWDPTGKGLWTIRGGIGVYHDMVTTGDFGNITGSNPPSYVEPTFYATSATKPIFALGTSDKYPFGYPFPPIPAGTLNSQGGIVGIQSTAAGWDAALRADDTYNYTLALERQLAGKLVATVAYSGSRTTGLPVGHDLTYQFTNNDVNRFAGDLIENLNVLTRLNHSFGAINYYWNGASSNYKALILSLTGHLGSHGVFQASYTRSSWWSLGAQYPDASNISQYWGPDDYAVPNRVSLMETLQLPRLQNFNPFVRRVLGGWELPGTLILQSGMPFNVYTSAPFEPIFNAAGTAVIGMAPGSGDYNADGYDYDFPNIPSTGYSHSNSRGAYLTTGLWPASAFGVPTMGTEGNELENRFRGPGFANVDLGILKSTPITERVNLQLRFEFFNIFNRPNLNGLVSDVSNPLFGLATGTFNPRYLQIGAKISF